MKVFSLSLVLAALPFLPSNAVAQIQPADSAFYGLTIVDLGKDAGSNGVASALTGLDVSQLRGRHWHLVVFMSDEGAYGAVDSRAGPKCYNWSVKRPPAVEAISLGRDKESRKLRGQAFQLRECPPFTIEVAGPRQVRVRADNDVATPSSPKRLQHDGVHDIVMRMPNMDPNFELPAFAKHAMSGVSLGPAADQMPGKRFDWGTGYMEDGLARYHAYIPQNTGRDLPATYGLALTRSDAGGKSHVMLTANHTALPAKRPRNEKIPVEGFLDKFIADFGAPSYQVPSRALWAYELDGRLVDAGAAATSNCLRTRELWEPFDPIVTSGTNIGPWGCALVAEVRFFGTEDDRALGATPDKVVPAGVVREYRVRTYAAHALGAEHFRKTMATLAYWNQTWPNPTPGPSSASGGTQQPSGVAPQSSAPSAAATGPSSSASAAPSTPTAPSAPQPPTYSGVAASEIVAPLGPWARALGVSVTQAQAELTGLGYEKAGSLDCVFVSRSATHVRSIELMLGTHKCSKTARVTSVRWHEQLLAEEVNVEAEITAASANLGETPNCTRRTDQTAWCIWPDTPQLPSVASIDLQLEAFGPGLSNARRVVAEIAKTP